MRVEKERQARGEGVDFEARLEGRFDVGDGVGESECHFLDRRRACFADVVAADRNRIPLRQFPAGPGKQVRDDPHGRTRRIDIGAARDVLLENIVLHRSRELPDIGALAPGHQYVQAEQDGRGGVDRHRGRDLVERDPFEQALHVGQRRDCHADPPDFSSGQRMVGIEADLGGQIERHGEPRGPLRNQISVAPVALFGRAETGILPHGPGAAAVHLRIDAAGVGKLARPAQLMAHERDIFRARRNEETPNPLMRSTKRPVTMS